MLGAVAVMVCIAVVAELITALRAHQNIVLSIHLGKTDRTCIFLLAHKITPFSEIVVWMALCVYFTIFTPKMHYCNAI